MNTFNTPPTIAILVCLTLFSVSPKTTAQEALPGQQIERPEKHGTPASLGLAGYAKVICSALYVSGREPDEAEYNSGYFLVPPELQEHVIFSTDPDEKTVTMYLGDSLEARAQYYGSQGCIISDADRPIKFLPVSVSTTLPEADAMDWPMGDRNSGPANPADYDKMALDSALNIAFNPNALTAALVVVHKGHIIAEGYDNGAHMQMQLESWSMGKSLTATLIGRMIQKGYFKLYDKAPITEWHGTGDPRSAIRISDLLQMRSGLFFTAHRDPEVEKYNEYLDHFYIYTGAIDAFEFAINRPLQFEPGTEGRYRNCDPLALGYIMRQELGKDYWTWPQRELFDKIGIREQVMETDPYGNFLLTGYDYGTARNWARLGMLYLNDGTWMGERILPAGFSEFVSSWAPGWKEPIYGGLFWLNGEGELALPDDAYMMAGAGGQYTIIVPSLDLVVVRMGHFRGGGNAMEALNEALPLIVQALGN